MKKLYFFMLTMLIAFAANATTVYFEDTANWQTIYAWAWDPSNAAKWPGAAVTDKVTVAVQGSTETKTLYAYTLPGAQTQIIFSKNGSPQTKDLPIEDGIVYSAANVNSKDPLGKVSGNTFIPAGAVEITYVEVYFPFYLYDHSVAYIHSWQSNPFPNSGKLEKVTRNGIEFWMATVDSRELPCTVSGWLLHNGSWGDKTPDLPGVTFKAGYVYELNGTSTPLADYKLPEEPDKDVNIYIPYYLFEKEDANIYSWSSELFGSWPGTALTKVTENGIDFWTVTLKESILPATVAGWKLNSSSGDTDDLPGVTFQGDYVYELDGTSTPLADYKLPEVTENITYAIRGQIFGDTNWADYNMTEDNGIWSYTGVAVPGDFGIKKMNNGVQVGWINSDGDGAITEAGEYTTSEDGSANWASSLSGEYTFAFNPEANTLTITKLADPVWYASYDINGAGWTFNNELSKEGDIYRLELNLTAETNYFTFTNAPMENWTVTAGGTRFGSGDADVTLGAAKSAPLVAGSDKCFILPAGAWTITLDPATMTLSTDIATGVSAINAATEVVEYYNLQGVRVANPQSGLYIRRQGANVTKVLVK